MWAIVINEKPIFQKFNAIFKVNLSKNELKQIEEILQKLLPDGFVVDENTQLVYVVINGEVKPFPLTHLDSLKFLKALTQILKHR